MLVKRLSDMDLLDQAERRYGKKALAEKLGVKLNQPSVWRSRAALSSKSRLMIEGLMAPEPRGGAADESPETSVDTLSHRLRTSFAAGGPPDLLSHLGAQMLILAQNARLRELLTAHGIAWEDVAATPITALQTHLGQDDDAAQPLRERSVARSTAQLYREVLDVVPEDIQFAQAQLARLWFLRNDGDNKGRLDSILALLDKAVEPKKFRRELKDRGIGLFTPGRPAARRPGTRTMKRRAEQ